MMAPSQWSAAPDVPYAVQEIYPALFRDEIWVAGGIGRSRDGAVAIMDRVSIFDPAAMRWRAGHPLPKPRHHPYLVAQQNQLFIFGGFVMDGGFWHMVDTIEVLSEDRWEEVGRLPIPLAETCAASIDGKIHLVSGRTPIGALNKDYGDHTDTARHFVFDVKTGEVNEAAPLAQARNSAAAVLVGDQFTSSGAGRCETETCRPLMSGTEAAGIHSQACRGRAVVSPLRQHPTASRVRRRDIWDAGIVFSEVDRFDIRTGAWSTPAYFAPSSPWTGSNHHFRRHSFDRGCRETGRGGHKRHSRHL
jgi:hypothetical protein